MQRTAQLAEVGRMKPRLARIVMTAGLLTVAVAVPTAHAATSPPAAAKAARACAGARQVPTGSTLTRATRATLCLLNAQRAAHGLRRLQPNRALGASARRYAHSLVANRFFSHVSPSGQTLQARISRSGYLRGANGWACGENLAWGSGVKASPAQIVAAWMASPGHRANILSARWRHIGIGVVRGAPVAGVGRAASYVTHFGWRG
jgi:uncharacterized protein YkwD